MKRKRELKNTFDTCYNQKKSWLEDYPRHQHQQVLKGYFSDYFTNDEVDYQKLKNGLLKNYAHKTTKSLNKSTEALKILFHHGYQAHSNEIHTEDLDEIIENHGGEILAHGVEEAKGGMYNLLSMCVTNKVTVQSMYWGPIIEGAPDISALSHGPYYIIFSTPMTPQKNPNYPTLDEIPYILVPFEENKVILESRLNEMVSLNMIEENSKDVFMSKLKTYCELNKELKAYKKQDNVQINTPKTINTNTFFSASETIPETQRIKDVIESGSTTVKKKLQF
jgi:hypothetical protein